MNPAEEQKYETVYIKDEISRCEDIEDLKESVFPMLKTQQEGWVKKINEIIEESGLNKSQFAETLGVSRMAINKWCNGALPKNRETFIRIGLAAAYNREKMDQLLKRYGQYPALYSKSLEDCVCIFVVNQNYGRESLAKYNYILETIKTNIIGSDEKEGEIYETVLMDEKLAEGKSQDELEKFIEDNSAVFSTTYRKFYAYVTAVIMSYSGSLEATVSEVADWQNWSSSLRQSVSAIRQKKWYPTRNKIISLGIHLSMGHEEIDEMLELAHMEPLCAKNAFESVIMFILDDASLNNMLDTTDADYDSDALCRYAREVLENFDMPEIESFLSELPENMDENW